MKRLALAALIGCGRLGFEPLASDPDRACVVDLAMGDEHGCALVEDGSLWCWGRNDVGQLGNGTSSVDPVGPARVLDGPYRTYRAGSSHGCAVRRDDAAVECWGNGGSRALGRVSRVDSPVPLTIAGLTADAVACGGRLACAAEAGVASCWGDADGGQLGNGTLLDDTPTPMPVSLAEITHLRAGNDHVCMGTSSGVACWGINFEGQLGVDPGMTVDACQNASDLSGPCSLLPVPVPGFTTTPLDVASGSAHACVIDADARTWCWGNNAQEQLGVPLPSWRSTPEIVAGLPPVRTLALGDDHSCALATDGAVWCWGENAVGQLGDGALEDRATPAAIPGLTAQLLATTPTGDMMCALTEEEVVCWGDNRTGAISGAPLGAVTSPVSVLPRCP